MGIRANKGVAAVAETGVRSMIVQRVARFQEHNAANMNGQAFIQLSWPLLSKQIPRGLFSSDLVYNLHCLTKPVKSRAMVSLACVTWVLAWRCRQ